MTTASASDRVGRAFWPYHFSGANGLSRQPHLFKSMRVGASYICKVCLLRFEGQAIKSKCPLKFKGQASPLLVWPRHSIQPCSGHEL